MGFLLDTNVVSELRKTRPNKNVLAWYEANRDADVFLSVLVIGEIRQGIERIRSRDHRRAEALDRWLAGLRSGYRDRILPVTVDVADAWGRMNVPPKAPPTIDGLMAATAAVHSLTLVTRNRSDVAHTNAVVLDPFA